MAQWRSGSITTADKPRLSISGRSYENFHQEKRLIQDSFTTKMSGFLTKETVYESQLIQLQKIYSFINGTLAKKDKKNQPDLQTIALCLVSSIKFMISISKEVQLVMEELIEIDYVDLMSWTPSYDMIYKLQDIESFVSIYELFCNNPRGFSHESMLFLFLENQKVEVTAVYSELIEGIFQAIERYSSFLKTLTELEGLDSTSNVAVCSKEIANINVHVQSSREELVNLISRAEEINGWSGTPKNIKFLRMNIPILYKGEVEREKEEENERCFLVLFNELIVLLSAGTKKYILHTPVNLSSWKKGNSPNTFIITIGTAIPQTLELICDTPMLAQIWLSKAIGLKVAESKENEMSSSDDVPVQEEEEDNENNTSTKPRAILSEMSNPGRGIIGAHSIRLMTKKNCFHGAVAFSWLAENYPDVDPHVLGAKWMELGLLKSLNGKGNKNSTTPVFNDKKTSTYQLKFGHCLNCVGNYWFFKARSAIDVSIDLLVQVVELFQENRAMISKYKIEGMNLVSLHPSYYQFCHNTGELQRVDLTVLDEKERFIFFGNIYNTLALHSYIAQHNTISTSGLSDLNCIGFLSNNKYCIGGYSFSLYQIDHAILRAKSNFPSVVFASKFIPKFKRSDARSQFELSAPNNLVNFILSVGTVESPDVIILRPDELDDQIAQHIEMFCDRKIHVFIQGTTRKIRLPKILDWFCKDFGDDARDVILFLMPYMSDSLREKLDFIHDPKERVSIKFDEFDWEFHYSISPLVTLQGREKELKRRISINRLISDVEQYQWSQFDNIVVEDVLIESPYSFAIPFQLLNQLIKFRKDELSAMDSKDSCYPSWKKHLKMLQASFVTYERQFMKTGLYQGLSFRPSPFKEDNILQFIPLNLHHHVTGYYGPNAENEPEYFTLTTMGVAAAHIYKYKNGGCLQMDKQLEHNGKAFQEKDAAIVAGITQRLDISVCQIITAIFDALISTIEISKNVALLFEQFARCGILAQTECLLSTIGAEAGMLGDVAYAIRYLTSCRLFVKFRQLDELWFANPFLEHVSNPRYAAMNGCESREKEESGFVFRLGIEKHLFDLLPDILKDGNPVPIACCIITQGINEQQSIAIYRNATRLQEEINREHSVVLWEYFNSYSVFVMDKQLDVPVAEMVAMMTKLQHLIATSENEKNIEILPMAADFTRKMNGLRITMCKSGKDRTSMAATWEQGRWLQSLCNSIPKERLVADIVTDLRVQGVRKRNAFKNIGKQQFAFNNIQRKLLPGPYRLPRRETAWKSTT